MHLIHNMMYTIMPQSNKQALPHLPLSLIKHSARSHPMADVTTQINHLDAQKKILIALPNVSLADVFGERISCASPVGGMYAENSGVRLWVSP